MSAHVLLKLLNEIRCQACQSFYLFFVTSNKFNNTRARMLDSIYHYDKITLKSPFCSKKKRFILSLCVQLCHGRHYIPFPENL